MTLAPPDTRRASTDTAALTVGVAAAGAAGRSGPGATPSPRDEAWRFTPLARLRGLTDDAPSDARLRWETTVPIGVTVTERAADDPVLAGVPTAGDFVAGLALRRSGAAVVVTVPAGVVPDGPIVLRLTGTDAERVVWGHLVVEVRAGADVTLLLEHRGSAQYAALVSVVVGAGARLRLLQVHDWDRDAVYAGQVSTRLGRDARLESSTVLLGGDLLRLQETVEFAGTGGDAALAGVWLTTAGQHHESRLQIDHAVPHCRSRVASRGALQGEDAHSVWVGDVLIRAEAVGTDTYELNRNLVLTDGARADSVPNLEISTGEVAGAGHASATGRFDDEQLFYLMSRGIPDGEARRLVVRGFFADVLGHVAGAAPELAARLTAAVEGRV